MTKWCVVYMDGKRECRSPWFSSLERARKAREIIDKKFGESIIYRD